ncbi:MAG: vWA domain-containing protein [Actinomycetota bacterium]
MRSRFQRWDGTQDPLGPDLDIGEILDEISHDVLSGMGADRALRRLMRRGLSGHLQGLDSLRRRLREQRRRLLESLNPEGPLAELAERLGEILSRERAALAERDDEDARMREAFLDALPSRPAAAIRELTGYRFVSPEAERRFRTLLEAIQGQVLLAYFRNLTSSMQHVTPEDLARLREMLGALNAMIAARERGEPYDFRGFMERFGDFFPENPKTLDELLEALARRLAAMSRLMASLSPEQRRELEELARSVLSDLDLAFEMEQLSDELRSLMPHLPWDEPASGIGDEPMPLAGAVDAIERMSELDELEEAVAGRYAGATIDDVDEDKLRRALGQPAVADLRRLKAIERALEEAGLLVRDRGRLELSPRGARRLGERALVKVFETLRHERPGAHDSREPGGPSEPTGATRPWVFGEVGQIAVDRTVFNAVLRSASRAQGAPKAPHAVPERSGRRRAPSSPVRLDAEDFELVEAETRTRTATALLLDLSFSMPLRDHWVPAKRMALALHALIEGKYPQDELYLIGFSDYARRLKPADLTAAGPLERVYGTNMQHAFMLAGRLLADHPRAARQVIMVTDGEPTAHLVDTRSERGPEVWFSWPPDPETIELTLAEALRLSSYGVTLNIFMLEEERGLVAFMEKLARLTGGRVFQAAGQELDHFVLRDFVRRR